MAKFFGRVGYGLTVEDPPKSGVWIENIEEVNYFGDVLRNSRILSPADKLNDDISVKNRISILADAYAIEHFAQIKYVEWLGVLWTVTEVEVQSPRLILHLGEVYNGPTA